MEKSTFNVYPDRLRTVGEVAREHLPEAFVKTLRLALENEASRIDGAIGRQLARWCERDGQVMADPDHEANKTGQPVRAADLLAALKKLHAGIAADEAAAEQLRQFAAALNGVATACIGCVTGSDRTWEHTCKEAR